MVFHIQPNLVIFQYENAILELHLEYNLIFSVSLVHPLLIFYWVSILFNFVFFLPFNLFLVRASLTSLFLTNRASAANSKFYSWFLLEVYLCEARISIILYSITYNNSKWTYYFNFCVNYYLLYWKHASVVVIEQILTTGKHCQH